jgi:iron complex outermembrane receptor protein
MKITLFRGASATALALLAGLCASQAWAADAPATAPAGVAEEGAGTIGELVVTAERREQNIETVPVAVTAFSAEQRALIGIQTLQDVTDFTPGLSYTAIDDRPYIRGVGRNTDNLSTASAVATYYNGVYYGANAAIILQKDDLFIGNIEIDRGPQNTLHGSNSDGGTINYVSQMPTHTFYAEARGSAANYGEYMGEAVVSGPLSDNVRFRLGGMYTDDTGGYFKNLDGPPQGGNISLGSSGKEHYLEAQLDANFDHLDAWGMISSGDSSANYHTAETVGNIPDNFFLNGAFEPNGFYGLCGLPGVPATVNGAGCAGGPTIVPGSVVTDPITANLFPGNNPGNVNPRQFIQEFTSTSDQTRDIALAGKLTYHFPSFDLTYIGGYQSFDYRLNFTTATDSGVLSYQLAGPTGVGAIPCQLTFASNAAACTQPLTIFPAPNTTYFEENDEFFSHEINITSTNDSPLQYLAGVYLYHEHYNQPVNVGVEPNQTQLVHPFYINHFGVTCPGGAPICAAPVSPASAFLTSETTLSYNDYAAFAQLSYKVNDQLKISGAIRYTNDHKFGYQTERFVVFEDAGFTGPFFTAGSLGANTPAIDLTPVATTPGAFPGTGVPTFNPVTGLEMRPLNASWSALTGEADVDWTPDPSTLAYFRYSRGYKSGGFDSLTIAANPETQPEYIDSFEIGGKKTVGSVFTLNGAAFYYNYYNDQVPLDVQEPPTNQIVGILYNVPLVHTYGVELEGVWRPVDALTLSLNYAFLSAKIANAGHCIEDTADPLATLPGATTAGCPAFTPGVPGSTANPNVFVQNVTGQTLEEAPRNKISFNALYTLHFDPGRLALSGSVIWKDTTYDAIFNRPDTLQKPYTLVNLRATWTDAKDRYNIIVFCDNVFNTIGYDSAAGLLLLPAQAGTPEDIVTGYGLTAPRTYGIEFEARFK